MDWVKFLVPIGTLGTFLLFLVGAWGAATFDSHRGDVLGGGGRPAGAPAPPDLSFTDYSPVGLQETCIETVAKDFGLSWDGGALGWTATDPPRPHGADANNNDTVARWRVKMNDKLAAASAQWTKVCLQSFPPPPPTQTATASAEPSGGPLAIDGTYNIEDQGASNSSCKVGGGSASFLVSHDSAGGITLTFGSGDSAQAYTGKLNAADLTFTAAYTEPVSATTATMSGRFAPGTGGDVLIRDGQVTFSGLAGGCPTTPFFARKPG